MGSWAEDLANECMAGEGVARRMGWKLNQQVTVLGAPCQGGRNYFVRR